MPTSNFRSPRCKGSSTRATNNWSGSSPRRPESSRVRCPRPGGLPKRSQEHETKPFVRWANGSPSEQPPQRACGRHRIVVAQKPEVVVVDHGMGHKRSGQVAGRREDRAKEQTHDPRPQHPSPSSGPPDLVKRRERDRGRYHADERHEQATKKELLPGGTR